MSEDFSFPSLPQPSASGAAGESGAKLPLTARSTVTDASASGSMAPPKPVAQGAQSDLEHRNKIPLEKGFSQVDWMRLSRATAPAPPRRDITAAEVRQHNTKEDCWVIFRNRVRWYVVTEGQSEAEVYDASSYLRFHPGGVDMLMKAAGRDCTALVNKYHPWVNIDALMERHLVGLMADPAAQQAAPPANGGQQQQQERLESGA